MVLINVIRIAQWNSRSFKARIPEIIYHSSNFDIFIISKAWLNMTDNIYIIGFDVVRQDRVGRSGGGVLILVRSSLRYQVLKVVNNCQDRLEVYAIDLFTTLRHLSIMSIYKPPSELILNARDWFDFLDQFKGKILIGGDFNLQENFRMPLLESMVDLDLHVLLNSEEPIHFDLVHCKESSLDLTIISSDIALLTRWRVSKDLWGSDHYPIFIFVELSAKNNFRHRRRRKLYPVKTDWDRFRSHLDDLLSVYGSNIGLFIDVKLAYRNFLECIKLALELSSPFPCGTGSGIGRVSKKGNREGMSPPPPCPWWNKDCEDLILSRKEAALKFKTAKTRQSFLYYKMIQARVRVGLRKIKKESFVKFCEDLRKDTNPSYVWNKVKCFRNRLNFSETANKYDPDSLLKIREQIDSFYPPWGI